MKYIKTTFRLMTVLSALLLTLILNSCDSMNEDVLPEESFNQAEDLNIDIRQQAPMVIDLLEGVEISETARVSITEAPTKGTVELIGASSLLQYYPNDDFVEGKDVLKYEICIGSECDEATIEIELGESDECVIAANFDEVSILYGIEQTAIYILENDEFCQSDMDVETLSVVVPPSNGVAVATDGLIFYYPVDEYIGTDLLVYSIATTSGESVYAIVEMTVSEEVQCEFSTTADEFSYTASELVASNGRVLIEQADYLGNDDFCDLAYNELQVYAVNQPEQATVEFTFNEGFSFVLDGDVVAGTHTFTYQACDMTQTNCSEATQITIEITGDTEEGCEILTATDDNYTYDQTVFDSEIDGRGFIFYTLDDLIANDEICQFDWFDMTITLASSPLNGTLTEYSNEGFGYTPGDNFSGEDSFTYELCDAYGNCSEAKVNILVNEPAGCVIEARDDSYELSQVDFDAQLDSKGYIDFIFDELMENDEFCQYAWGNLQITVAEDPASGTITYYSYEVFRYAPGDDFSGEDSFTYEMCDADGNCTSGVVSLIVQ